MEVLVTSSRVRFKNPTPGLKTETIADHYYGRRIVADVDGESQTFDFTSAELALASTEQEMIDAIVARLTE